MMDANRKRRPGAILIKLNHVNWRPANREGHSSSLALQGRVGNDSDS